MASRMDSICERYAAGCTKTEPKILQVKRGQKTAKRTRFSPKKAKPGAFWVLEGMGTVENGSNQMRKPGKLGDNQGTDLSRLPPRSGLDAAHRAAGPLGTRFWSGCGRAHQGAGKGRCHPVPTASPREGGAGLVLRAIFGEGLCIDYHFFLRKKSTSARRMAKLTRITAG